MRYLALVFALAGCGGPAKHCDPAKVTPPCGPGLTCTPECGAGLTCASDGLCGIPCGNYNTVCDVGSYCWHDNCVPDTFPGMQ